MPAKCEFLATRTNKMQTLVSSASWVARAGPGGVAVCVEVVMSDVKKESDGDS